MDIASADVLREAAACGDVKKVSELLTANNLILDSKHTINSWTALHWAAKRNHLPVVKLLLEKGADKTLQTSDGKVALELTTNIEIIETLGGGLSDTREAEPKSASEFVPSYLKTPSLPTYCKAEMNAPVKKPPQLGQTQNTSTSNQQDSGTNVEVVLKARVANGIEQDFIEVELENTNRTLKGLLDLLSQELQVPPEHISKIRKLPNTIIRKDKDVGRLTDFQELEIFLSTESVGIKLCSNSVLY